MYSPAIAPGLIPVLYRLGKARGVPMTELVCTLAVRRPRTHRAARAPRARQSPDWHRSRSPPFV